MAGQRRELTADAEAALAKYDWRGNIRELRNALERAAILASGEQIGRELLPERIGGTASGGVYIGGAFTFKEIEREHMLRVLATHPKVEDAARILGATRPRYGGSGNAPTPDCMLARPNP